MKIENNSPAVVSCLNGGWNWNDALKWFLSGMRLFSNGISFFLWHPPDETGERTGLTLRQRHVVCITRRRQEQVHSARDDVQLTF